MWNPESTAWNPESETLLDYLKWGEIGLLCSLCFYERFESFRALRVMGKCTNRHLFFLRRILITSAVTRKISSQSSSAIYLLFSALTLSVSYLFYNYKNIQILNE